MKEATKVLIFAGVLMLTGAGVAAGTQAYIDGVSYGALQAEIDEERTMHRDRVAAIVKQWKVELDASNSANEELHQQLLDIPLPPVKAVPKTIVKEKRVVVHEPPTVESCVAMPLPTDMLQQLSR